MISIDRIAPHPQLHKLYRSLIKMQMKLRAGLKNQRRGLACSVGQDVMIVELTWPTRGKGQDRTLQNYARLANSTGEIMRWKWDTLERRCGGGKLRYR
jgi:hypothetical protein